MPFFPVGTQQTFIQGGTAPRSNPLPFYSLFLLEKVPHSYSFYWQMIPPFTYLIQNEDCKKSRFFSLKIDFSSHPGLCASCENLTPQAHGAPGLFFHRSRVLDQRKNTGCFAGPVLNTEISRTTGWFPTCGSSGGFIVNAINDIYR